MKKRSKNSAKITQLDKKCNRLSLALCTAGSAFFICAVCFLVGTIGHMMWCDDRDFLLDNYDKKMVARLENGLIKETLNYSEEAAAAGDADPWTLTYVLDDNETVFSSYRSEITPTITDKKVSFMAKIKGTNIPRRHDTTEDGEPCISYRLPFDLSYTFSNNYTVNYDWIVQVTDQKANDKIGETYKKLKFFGLLAILGTIVGFVVFAPIIVAIGIAMSRAEKELAAIEKEELQKSPSRKGEDNEQRKE